MPIVNSTAGLVKPDVYVVETPPPVQVLGRGTGVIGFVGQFNRGPLNEAIVVSNPSDLIAKFGDFTQGLDGFMTAITCMQQGSNQIKIVRIGDNGVTSASGAVSGATTYLFSEQARTPGTWGNSITRTVTASTISGYVDVEYRYGTEVSVYKGKNFDSASADYLVTAINQDSNRLINVTRVAASNVTELPAAGSVTFASGSNGTNTGSSLGDSFYVGTDAASGKSGLVVFEADDEVSIIFSARATSTVNSALITQATNIDLSPRMAVLSLPYGTSIADQKTAMATINTDFAVMAYPWQKIYNSNNATEEYMPAASFVAGLLSTLSPHVSPSRQQIFGTIGVERKLTRAEMTSLINYRVLTVNPESGLGFVCNSGITTSSNGGKRQIVRRRMVNYLSTALERGLQPFVSRPHTQELRQGVTTSINSFLERELRDGRIGNSQGGKAYSVKCDSANNPPAVVQANHIIIEIAVSLLAPADIFIVKLDCSEEKIITS